MTIILSFIFSLAAGVCGIYALIGSGNTRMIFLPLFLVLFILSGFTGYKGLKFAQDAVKYIKNLVADGEYYKAILDGIPFPVHATDNNMKWTFINKAFEDLLVKNGKIKDRDSSYGLACCAADADICNTPNCGIKQLANGTGESYFEWLGSKCKQYTSHIIDSDGNKLGFVETVNDLTKIIEVNEYNQIELDRLTGNLIKLADGDLELDLKVAESNHNTDKSREQFLNIASSLSKAKDAIEMMTSDAETLCEAAIEGRLEARADTSKHNGEYKNVIKGINKTLDSIMAPIDLASDYISSMAEGIIVEPIDNVYKGKYAKLIDSINSVIGSLNILISESNKLAEAGINGNLKVRGSSDNLKGGYAQIVDGFNNMLDSIIMPLDEAIAVLSKMAVSDFTVNMTTGYKGMLGTLSDSMNQVLTTFHAVEDFLIKTSVGNFSLLEVYKQTPRRSENDKLRPAATAMMQSVFDLVSEANMIADNAADGNLAVRGDSEKFEGVYKKVIIGINRMIEVISEPMNDSISVLEQWATGDLSVSMTKEYNGDYAKMTNAMNTTVAAFRDLLSTISEAATQVASGSEEIASGSQSLSQGTTEQASSIQELTASVSEIAAQTKNNAKNASNAKDLSNAVHDEAVNGNGKMKQMQSAMRDISESSANIAKIIKVIDDIAFQTNILALNAAVEAARAGQAGRGFAVVAEEVRNLAARSAKAAKETTELIENSTRKVEVGTSIANDTATALDKIVSSIEKSTLLVSEISESSIMQATGISQINTGLEQVATVVQSNSASSEQSAASSTELSSQAESLMEMVSKFNLGKTSKPALTAKPVKTAKSAPAAVPKRSIDLDFSGKNKYGEF